MLHNGHHAGSKATELPREAALSMGGDSKKGGKPRSVHFSGGGKQVPHGCPFVLPTTINPSLTISWRP